ncbi:hypothetical protein GCM10017688_66640 [Streptomyces ramulosus]
MSAASAASASGTGRTERTGVREAVRSTGMKPPCRAGGEAGAVGDRVVNGNTLPGMPAADPRTRLVIDDASQLAPPIRRRSGSRRDP